MLQGSCGYNRGYERGIDEGTIRGFDESMWPSNNTFDAWNGPESSVTKKVIEDVTVPRMEETVMVEGLTDDVKVHGTKERR